jgi:DNA processing protein
MDARDLLSEDGRAVLALCSQLGLEDEMTAFTLTEWNDLARRIQASEWKRPSALAGQSASAIAATLGIVPSEAERVAGLLERGARLALELENLFARGLWAVTRADAGYPARLRQSLKHQAPPVLFGAGEISLLARGGVAVVGSRNLDPAGLAFAQEIGRRCAAGRMPVVSGGARGTDRVAMQAALEEGDTAAGVLADSLERTVQQPDLRHLLQDERLVLLTPYSPTAGFSVGAAMGRNKVIYGLADYAVVVSSDLEKGGTWAGAVEALRGRWCPVFARDGADVPAGNRELLKRGAAPITEDAWRDDLAAWLPAHATVKTEENELFAETVIERPKRCRSK